MKKILVTPALYNCLNAKILIVSAVITIFTSTFFTSKESHAWFWPDKKKRACGSVEWEFQNAFECLANPLMWKRWSEIGEAYGSTPEKSLGVAGCPIFIKKITKYNLSSDEKPLFFYIAETNGDIGFKYKFKEIEKKEFCHVANEKGWIDAYLQEKTPKKSP